MSRPAPTDLSAEALFAPDYYAARAMFLEAAAVAGAKVQSVEHPTAKGPGGRGLWMDVAILGKHDAQNGFGMVSATHGPEGYVGSAAQCGFLQSDFVDRLGNVRAVLLHAHNAFGYAWDTRFNEDNIDLNRNYVDFDSGDLPDNPGYTALADAIAPADLAPETLEAADRALLAYAMAHGFPALQAAITAGQFTHPAGLYWAGNAASWSRRTLEKLLVEPLKGCAQSVIIDWHTGLGPTGYGEVICEKAPGDPRWDRAQAIFGGECRSPKDGTSSSADLAGTLDVALERLLEPSDTVCVALEFGTVDTREVYRATRASSWLHTKGDPEGPDAAAIRAVSKATFCVDDPAWRAAIWARSVWAIGRALTSLEA